MRLLAALQLCLLCFTCSIFRCNSVVTEESILESIVELSSHNLTSNLEEWESDIAIMFYAPWCKYCKQLLPSWGTIAALSESNRNLVVGKFDCEASEKSGEICKDLDVDRYPSLFFLGYGNFNQAMGGAVVGRSMPPRLVRYVADLYPEAIYDWVSMLSFLSSTHRRWDDVMGFFTGKTRAQKQLANMHVRVSEAEQRAHLFGQELEMYKANEVFDGLEDHGDPFPLMHQLAPDPQNLPLRMCVAEMTGEFCRYNADDAYCKILPQCAKMDLEPEACRPEVCPFKDKRGCVVASTCMQPSVMQQYREALEEAATKAA